MLRAKFKQWFQQRFHLHGIKQLKQKDILIFLYQQGYLYVVLIIITFIAGINYANNLILGFCFLISAILCISFYLTFKQLHQLKIECHVPELGQVAEQLNISIYLQQPRTSTRYLFIVVDEQSYPVLMNQLQQTVELKFRPEQRGRFFVPHIRIYSTYPLGLVRSWTYLYIDHLIWIAPQALEYQRELDSVNDSGQHSFDEFKELRSYQHGDSLNHVSWKHAARGQGLFIKQFEQQVDRQALTIDYAQIPATDHEQKLGLMMGLIAYCEHQGTPYTVILPKETLSRGLGTVQYDHARRMLAQA